MFLYNMYMLFLFFLSFILFFFCLSLMFMDIVIYLEFIFLLSNFMSVEYVIFLDWMSTMFLSVVLFISSMIFYYMKDYMEAEKNYIRFIYLMLMFIGSMMFMIMSMDLITILIGWDGLGLVSYLLVIFYQNMKSNSAGMLTALSNRIGDAFFMLSIAMMVNFGSWKFMFIYDSGGSFMLIMFMLMLAAMTKSAQVPFSSWLPAAMAAPTPVSSLVHSSTLVTAGVYLLIRISSKMNNWLLLILLYSSLLTMFMAGLNANFEYDLKKIIALSTLSQLGMMIVIICVGSSELALFHLFIHALFKALLFMCAGAMIHNFHGLQDMRLMGGAMKYLPITSVCLIVSSFSLCGVPFLSGFYSKDLIVEVLSMSGINTMVYFIFYFSIGLTVSYSFRLMYYMFFGEINYLPLSCFSDSNNSNMNNSMLGLVFFVIFMGSCLMWINLNFPYYVILPNFMKMLVMVMIVVGIIFGVFLNWSKFKTGLSYQLFKSFYFFFSSMWYLPILSTKGVSLYFLKGGSAYFKLVDNGWFEFYGSMGLMAAMVKLSQSMQLLSKNNIKMYLIISFMLLLLLFLF
uniref:NADH dehydrogenase subunit 5 n=1 Tax=Scolytoplatypus skyliuae TaxID=2894163 RepID=UPI0023AB1272|nr:NADH dehydrogenase subunit 5 [Scolytoplatypus skyliuae]WCB99755.1 NADH dehydrogenase subunit 5 [Scolytoplatypus skyliuae]